MICLFEKIEKAMSFAAEKHHGQTRKGSTRPYILHPFEACEIATTITLDEDIIAAVILHDVVEDTDTTIEEIREKFGDRVGDILEGDNENKYEGEDKSSSWKKRKEESLKKLENTKDEAIKILWLSDKLSNIRSIYKGFAVHGHKVWDVFNEKDPKEQKWYYTSVLKHLEDLKKYGAYHEYKLLVDTIFKDV